MKINKKAVSAVLCGSLLMSAASAAELKNVSAVKNALCIKTDGNYLMSESYITEENFYLPLRDVCESLGAEVLWDNDTRTVNIKTGNTKSEKYNGEYFKEKAEQIKELPAYYDSVTIVVDGETLNSTNFIANDKTYISVDALEALSSNCYLDNSTATFRIYSDNYNTKDCFATYGDNTISKEEFLEIIKFIYQGDYQASVSDKMASISNYLLFNASITEVAEKVGIDMSEEALKKFYEENPIEKVAPSLDLKNTDGVKNNILKYYYAYTSINENMNTLFTPSDEEIEEIYKATPYASKPYYKAQHILISKDEKGEGLKKIEDLLKKAKKKGTDFTELMLENSEDPGSQSTPEGYIFTEGEMVDSFYQAAVNTPVGEISDVFESEYGYHILKKVAQWDNGLPMDEIKDELVGSYNTKKLDEILLEELVENDAWFDTQEAVKEVVKIVLESSGEMVKE